LIANAIEHGGGVVEVRGAHVGDAVKVEVLDDGPGLPKPVAEMIRRRAGQRGRGLGLGIAADIISGHGGRLWAAPSVGGARLMLELPGATACNGSCRQLSRRPRKCAGSSLKADRPDGTERM